MRDSVNYLIQTDDNLTGSYDNNYIELDYFGIISLRFENISESELELLIGKFIDRKCNLERTPDIIFKFVTDLNVSKVFKLGEDFALFDDNNFYVVSDKISLKRVLIPFDKIGGKIEIICERGLKSIPLFYHLINLYLIKNNYVPIHSSGLYYRQKGLLAMGWSNGGKTSVLLSLAANGAEYVGDEWLAITNDGSEMIGYPIPLSISKWQLKQMPKLKAKVSKGAKIADIFIEFILSFLKLVLKIGDSKFILLHFPKKILYYVEKLLKKKIAPHKVFGDKVRNVPTPVDFLFLTLRHQGSDIKIEKCKSYEIICRMINSNNYEQNLFYDYYNAFKYAFPERSNRFLDEAKEIHAQQLLKALKDKKAYKVISPSPVSLNDLYKKINLALDI